MKSVQVGRMAAVGVAALSLAGCLATGGVTSKSGPAMDSVRLEKYDGPKARIAVAEFEDKMYGGGYRHEYGRGMRDMLTTALFQSSRYIVLERERMAALEAERARRGSKGKIEDADLLVTAAITGFDPGESGMSGGVGGLLGKKMLGGLTGSFKQARVTMDIRVIDVDTGRIIAATSAEGKATTVGAGIAGIGGPMGGALKGFEKGPMEGAIREMIKASVDFIVENTPSKYYRNQ
jgi:curli biogenesis system outer membrane secretion channel CsgG